MCVPSWKNFDHGESVEFASGWVCIYINFGRGGYVSLLTSIWIHMIRVVSTRVKISCVVEMF